MEMMPTRRRLLTNSPLSFGLMRSTLTMSSSTGSEPEMRMVCNRFISWSAFVCASWSVVPVPLPEMLISLLADPLSPASMLSVSTSLLSR